MGRFFQVPLSQLLFIWFTVHIQYISGSSHVYMHLLAKMDSISKAYGWPGLSITHIWPPSSLSAQVWLGRFPHFKNEKCMVWAGPSLLSYSSCCSYFGVLVLREWISNHFTLGVPIYLLSQIPPERCKPKKKKLYWENEEWRSVFCNFFRLDRGL